MKDMLSSKTIAIIGAGYLGSNILDILLKKKHNKVIVTRRNKIKLDTIQKLYPQVQTTRDNTYAAQKADIIIVATKQDSFGTISSEIKNVVEGKLVISVGPTYTIKKLEELFGKKVIHLMMPIYPKSDIISYTPSKSCGKTERGILGYIFGSTVKELPEGEMSIATAYTILRCTFNSFIEPIVQLGIEKGMSEDNVRGIVGEMFKSVGEEIQKGVNPDHRLEGASGGFNEKTFTSQFWKTLEPLSKKLEKELSNVVDKLEK
jgi:pyrroline-5-carboxylate reductase